MWVEVILICGVIIYHLLRRFFFSDSDTLSDYVPSHSTALFSVAHRLEKLYGGKTYVGLRIPDPDSASPRNIDLVLLTKREAVVISVINLSGFVSVDEDGSWVSTGSTTSSHKTQRIPDPVAEAKTQVAILEAYLEQRGVALPEGFLSCKVVCPSPNFCAINPSNFPSEVVTHEQWIQMKPEQKSLLSGWIKGAFRSTNKEMQESTQQNLGFVLSTAPMWDRLELKGNKYLLGDFLEFKGKQDDTQALRNIKRSKVSRLVVQRTSMLGLAHSKLQVLYSLRDYQSEGAASSEWTEVTVRSSTEALFQPQDSAKVRKFKLSSIISMSLSA